jgi:hypothetical protein
MKRIGAVLLVLAGLAGWLGWQAWRLPDDVVARIDGVDIPVRSLDALLAVVKVGDATATRRSLLDGAVESHALARWHDARRDNEHAHSLVGYSDEALYENQLFATLRHAFATQLNNYVSSHGIDGPMSLLEQPVELDKKALEPYLELNSALLHAMTEEQEKAAAEYVLGYYRLPFSQRQPLTLWDLYSRMNIQLKVQMHEYNLPFIREAIGQHLATQFVIGWFRDSGEFSQQEVIALEKLVSDRMEKEELLHDLGLLHDIHDDNPALREAMARITDAEVRQYYDSHRDEFRWVEKVRARHIRLDSQERADEVVARIKAGELSFEQAIATYSTAPDRNAEVPGDLGEIVRGEAADDWLRGLAFVQPEGVVSPPFRSPQSNSPVYWEVVFLDEKVMGDMPLDDPGVRYEASKKLARASMQQEFERLRAELIEAVDLRVNDKLLGEVL